RPHLPVTALDPYLVEGHSPRRDLHSFPTRRSSDLVTGALEGAPHVPTGDSAVGTPPFAEGEKFFGAGLVFFAVGDGPAFLDAKVDRKSTRLNSSHLGISYAVFCLKKKNNNSVGEQT